MEWDSSVSAVSVRRMLLRRLTKKKEERNIVIEMFLLLYKISNYCRLRNENWRNCLSACDNN
jgi:hypothetical protein